MEEASCRWHFVFNFDTVFIYVCACVCVHINMGCYRGQPVGVGSPLPLCGLQGLNLDHQAWWQTPLPADPSHQTVSGLFMLFVPDGKNERFFISCLSQ